jgi:hypothetical protein
MSLAKSLGLPLTGLVIAGLGFGAALILQPMGTDEPYGKDPSKPVINQKYPPTVFALVYLKMRADPNAPMTFDMQQQFFDLTVTGRDPTTETFNQMVEKIFVQRFRDNKWNQNPGSTIPEADVWLPFPNKTGVADPNSSIKYEPSKDMLDIYHGKPVKIYVFIDNPGVEFQKAWPITFSKFGGDALAESDTDKWKPFKRSKNDTYFNAVVGAKGFSSNQFLQYDNLYRAKDCWGEWCGDEGKEKDPKDKAEWPDGKPKHRKYAINYNLRVPTGVAGRIIPIAIDPDTGNGTGAPPPADK